MCLNDLIAARDAAKGRYQLAIECASERYEIVCRFRWEYRAACDRVCVERARVTTPTMEPTVYMRGC